MSSDNKASNVLAEQLVGAAVEGLDQLRSGHRSAPPAANELRCVQCESLLFEPTTLEDGTTVCRPCVRKYRDGLRRRPGADDPLALPAWGGTPETVGFGENANTVLTELTRRCCPDALAAAKARQDANALFAGQRYAEAVEAYSAAISGSPFPDTVLHCNRSVARLRLGDAGGAAEDGELAVACSSLSAAGPGGPMWAKAWFRLGQALLAAGQEVAEAAFALAMSAAATPDAPTLPQLLEASRSLLALKTPDAASSEGGAGVVENLKDWLRQAQCPSIQSRLTSLPAHSGSDFQLGIGEPGGTSGREHASWIHEQMECALCLGLFWEPTTIPCGHTLCRPCLARTLDHAFDTPPACPMCRKDLAPYLGWLNARAVAAGKCRGIADSHGGAQIPVNHRIGGILRRHFQAELQERGRQVDGFEAAAGGGDAPADTLVVPIFICSMAMPAVACPLHIFEPRYRLMMRRCIESGQRQFGMCLSPELEYGTMLRILDFHQLPDGRSQIKTLGTRRFQVLKWGEKDGYATGNIRWVDDIEEERAEHGDQVAEPALKSAKSGSGSPVAPAALELRQITDRLLNRVLRKPEDRLRLDEQLGPRPASDGEDGPHCPAFVFWCAGLASMPPRRAYQLCFADEYRQHPAKRLEAVLAHFQRKVLASEPREDGGAPDQDGASDEDE